MSRILAVLGPTAAGKSEIAFRLALDLGGSVLSVDSMQVYRGMDIGTAKPSPEQRRLVRHHMIDVAEPDETYTVAAFQAEARRAVERSGPVVIGGGSGLHFRAVVDPLVFAPHDPSLRERLEELGDPAQVLLQVDPGAGHHVDLSNRRRVVRALEILELTGLTSAARAATPEARMVRAYQPRYPFVAVGIDPGEGLAHRVELRLAQMRRAGFLEEVRSLAGRLSRTAAAAVGYRQLLEVVEGRTSEGEGFASAKAATMALARRQRTFFRRDPRIRWVAWRDDPEELYRDVCRALEVA